MQIICPNCSTSYEVPDSVFGGRPRKLRCVQCGHQWRAGPSGEEESAVQAAPAVAEAPAAPAPQSGGVVNQFLLSPEQRSHHVAEHHAPVAFEQPAYAEAEDAPPAEAQFEGHVLGTDPGTTPDEHDGFYDLVIAARNKAIEFEPEPPPPPRIPITSPVFLAILVLLFLFGLVLLEHHAVVELFPATAGLFALLGM